jgi:hypothetical protein
MASALRHSTGLKNFSLDSGINTAFDTTGIIRIYTGSPPANADAAPTGTLLGTLTLAAASFGAASGGVITAGAIGSDVSADATASAGWFRMKLSGDGDGISATEKRMDGTVDTAGNSPDMVIDVTAIQIGGTIACSSLTYTAPV